MTDRDLKKLKREDLLELLIAQSKENEDLKSRLRETMEQLNSRRIAVENAGSIAEAALQLNGIFTAAQDAAAQYLENIQQLSSRQEEISARLENESRETADRLLAETEAKCQALETDTTAKCDAMIQRAKLESESYWHTVSEKLEAFYRDHAGLKELLSFNEQRKAGQ